MIRLDTVYQGDISSYNNILAAFEYSRSLAAIYRFLGQILTLGSNSL